MFEIREPSRRASENHLLANNSCLRSTGITRCIWFESASLVLSSHTWPLYAHCLLARSRLDRQPAGIALSWSTRFRLTSAVSVHTCYNSCFLIWRLRRRDRAPPINRRSSHNPTHCLRTFARAAHLCKQTILVLVHWSLAPIAVIVAADWPPLSTVPRAECPLLSHTAISFLPTHCRNSTRV